MDFGGLSPSHVAVESRGHDHCFDRVLLRLALSVTREVEGGFEKVERPFKRRRGEGSSTGDEAHSVGSLTYTPTNRRPRQEPLRLTQVCRQSLEPVQLNSAHFWNSPTSGATKMLTGSEDDPSDQGSNEAA